MRVALVYDMDACRTPTGVTRHALAQIERLARRPDVELTVVSGKITEPDGLAYWDSMREVRRVELPLRTRDMLRAWRSVGWPTLERWTGPVDWAYSPAESPVPTRRARRAVTSHDVLQDLRYGGSRRRRQLGRTFARADLIGSVSNFNTGQLLDAFPECRGRVAHVPNGAEDLFFEPATEAERRGARADLGLPAGLPFLVSVANFQPRKNLVRLVRAAARLPEVAGGELGLALVGVGSKAETRMLREAIASVGPRAVITTPGYRQGIALRAAYAEARALVFASTCESFGIPAVEAMAVGCPAVLADSTALPEIGGAAGWYFDPEDEEAISGAIRGMLDDGPERRRRVALGRSIAEGYRWSRANDRLMAALRGELET